MTKFLTLTYPGLLLTSFCLISQAIAQVTPDNTLSTTVDSADGINFAVENGDRAGNNLFHSFEQFSVPDGGSASFNNLAEIENIFSRVTGGNISEIQGAINANGGANLLLINPAGIVFGENASLNIGGSFLTTTADSLLFEGGEFSASDPQAPPLLSINRPIGLNFGDNPGSIINRAGTLTDPVAPPPGLQVQPGQNITLVGGEIQLDGGFLTASGGKIELGSVAEATQIEFIAANDNLNYETDLNFDDILLSNLGRVDASGLGGGEVRLQGRNIVLTGGSKIISNTFGDLSGQNTILTATDSLQVIGTTDLPNLIEPLEAQLEIIVPLRSSITSITFGGGDAGNIEIDTQRVIQQDGGHITASSFGSGNINSGSGGNITIDATDVDIFGAAPIGESGAVRFGLGRLEIEVNASSALGTITDNEASAGTITIDTDRLNVRDGGLITTNSFVDGAGGNLVINATESVNISGSSPSGIVNSIIVSAAANGEAGDISIQTDRLNVSSGGQINVRTRFSQAGNLEINTKNLLLNRGFLDAETLAGDRGNINVIDAETIFIRNGSSITTNATQLSTGGDINLNSEAIAIDNSSNISAIAEAGRGGNIQINSQALFREPNAEITAASNLGIDGTITFNNPDVDPTSGIIELSSVPIDADAILAQDLCRVENQNIAGGNSFVVTGRGGLTPTSADSLGNINRVVNWMDEADVEVSSDGVIAVKRSHQTANKDRSVIQSQGFAVAPDGSLWLTANTGNTTPQNSRNYPDCQI